MPWTRSLSQSERVSKRDDTRESGVIAEGKEPSARPGRWSHLKLWTRLTSLIDEEMPKCIWEPLFALLPTDTGAEWDHLSQESLLHLPPRVSDSVSLPLPWVLYHARETWILSKDEAKLVCKLSLSEIKTQLKPCEWNPVRVSSTKRRHLWELGQIYI